MYLVLTIVVVVASFLLLVVSLKFKSAVIRWSMVGLLAGFGLSFAAVFIIGAAHWFGWFNLSIPPFTIAGAAFTPGLWVPAVGSIAGLITGVAVALLKPEANP